MLDDQATAAFATNNSALAILTFVFKTSHGSIHLLTIAGCGNAVLYDRFRVVLTDDATGFFLDGKRGFPRFK